MSNIIAIANELQALQGRITADKAALLEARAVMEAEHAEEEKEETSLFGMLHTRISELHVAQEMRRKDRHKRLMAFIDGQIAAKDEAIEGEAVGEFKQAAE